MPERAGAANAGRDAAVDAAAWSSVPECSFVAGIGIVLNPKSRRNLRDPGAATRLARLLGDHGVLRTASSHDELGRIAEDFRRQDLDVLSIAGGDGTGHVTLTAFVRAFEGAALPPLAFLRGGTMNTVANALGVPRARPERLLKALVRAYALAKSARAPLPTRPRYLLRAGGHYGFLFGTGVVCGFLAEYYGDGGGAPTPQVAARTLARGIGSALVGGAMIRRMAAPFRGEVAFPGSTVAPWPARDYLSVAGGTVDQMGLGFRPFPRSGEDVAAIHLLGIHASAATFVRELPRIFRGLPLKPTTAQEALITRAVLRTERGPLRYMIDGDLHEVAPEPGAGPEAPASLEVALGPRITFVRL